MGSKACQRQECEVTLTPQGPVSLKQQHLNYTAEKCPEGSVSSS